MGGFMCDLSKMVGQYIINRIEKKIQKNSVLQKIRSKIFINGENDVTMSFVNHDGMHSPSAF